MATNKVELRSKGSECIVGMFYATALCLQELENLLKELALQMYCKL